jgi:DNA-binding transcriptional ArsR family regulator
MGEKHEASSAKPRRPVREPLSAEAIEATAERLKLIADPKRIALLEALNDGEAGVQELAERIGTAHQNASYHLAQLYRAGVVERRAEGSLNIYAISDWSAWWVIEQLARL